MDFQGETEYRCRVAAINALGRGAEGLHRRPLGRAPAWIVVVLLCRELAITGLRGIASQEGLVIAASAFGKLKTVYMATAIGFLLWHHPTFPEPYTVNAHAAGIALLYIATFCSMYSGAHYFIQFVKHTRIKL